MDFVTSHFGKMKLWRVEHFYNIFVLTFGCDCYCIQLSNHAQKWGQICCKSVQLVRVSSFWNDLLQNPYFSNYFKNLTPSLLKNSGISKSPHNVTSMYEVVCTPIYLFEIMKDYLTFYCFIRAASKANLRAIFKLIIFYDLIIARSLR